MTVTSWLWHDRTFVWDEITDVYVKETPRRGGKNHHLRGRLRSGKSFFMPGLTGDDLTTTRQDPVGALYEIRDDLLRRVREHQASTPAG
ncbi:hypothetical protein [Actinomadura gamaensis]|uniref:Uncharacterized protein n=1 Tax=Actinomadura gamaensis TaxID=1763541 RepID=A0ABV9UA36_9ACTN